MITPPLADQPQIGVIEEEEPLELGAQEGQQMFPTGPPGGRFWSGGALAGILDPRPRGAATDLSATLGPDSASKGASQNGRWTDEHVCGGTAGSGSAGIAEPAGRGARWSLGHDVPGRDAHSRGLPGRAAARPPA